MHHDFDSMTDEEIALLAQRATRTRRNICLTSTRTSSDPRRGLTFWSARITRTSCRRA